MIVQHQPKESEIVCWTLNISVLGIVLRANENYHSKMCSHILGIRVKFPIFEASVSAIDEVCNAISQSEIINFKFSSVDMSVSFCSERPVALQNTG